MPFLLLNQPYQSIELEEIVGVNILMSVLKFDIKLKTLSDPTFYHILAEHNF